MGNIFYISELVVFLLRRKQNRYTPYVCVRAFHLWNSCEFQTSRSLIERYQQRTVLMRETYRAVLCSDIFSTLQSGKFYTGIYRKRT